MTVDDQTYVPWAARLLASFGTSLCALFYFTPVFADLWGAMGGVLLQLIPQSVALVGLVLGPWRLRLWTLTAVAAFAAGSMLTFP